MPSDQREIKMYDTVKKSDTTLLEYPEAESRILQGVTTEIGGNCGLSVAPVGCDPEKRDAPCLCR